MLTSCRFTTIADVQALPEQSRRRATPEDVNLYQSLGWRIDADLAFGDIRAVQLTPPHSVCSIAFGLGFTTAEPGSAQRLELVVADIDAAREDVISRGVEVSEVFHRDGGVLF